MSEALAKDCESAWLDASSADEFFKAHSKTVGDRKSFVEGFGCMLLYAFVEGLAKVQAARSSLLDTLQALSAGWDRNLLHRSMEICFFVCLQFCPQIGPFRALSAYPFFQIAKRGNHWAM